MTIKQRLLNLASAWRTKAKNIKDKYQAIVPVQSEVAVSSLETCAEEAEDLAKEIHE